MVRLMDKILREMSRRKVRTIVGVAIAALAIVTLSKDLYKYFGDIANLSPLRSSQDGVKITTSTVPMSGVVESTDWNIFLFANDREKEDYLLNPLRSTLEFDKDVYDIMNAVSLFVKLS